MKIKEITKEEVVFDNGGRIWFDQEYDDYAYNYADFYQINDIVQEWEFDENLKFELCSDSRFRFGNEGRMIFVPCYSYQNGYYSTDVYIGKNTASSGFIKWFYEGCTFKLSILEHELLKYFYRDGYKYIARDKDNGLYLYKSSPIKDVEMWAIDRDETYYPRGLVKGLEDFKNLFLFVRWEDSEPKSIEDILDNCEVIDYDE